MSKNDGGFLQGGLDPAVQAALGSGAKRQKERGMPRRERAKLKKNQERQDARNGGRAVYDLDPVLISAVKKLAEVHGTSASQVAGIALHLFLQAVESGEVDLAKYRVRLAKNPRYEYLLEFKE